MENQNSLTTLGLQLPTDPRWVNMAEISLESILTDHAYCEQKASLSCIALISQYPEHFEMVKELAPIVTEEWGHFRLVIQELEKLVDPLKAKIISERLLRPYVNKS